MKRVGITKHPDFPIEEWSRLKINLEDLFEIPVDFTGEEVRFANEFMETVQLDTDDDEGLVELVMKRSSLMSLFIHMRRIILQRENKRQSKNNI
jgi:hypothetical protein